LVRFKLSIRWSNHDQDEKTKELTTRFKTLGLSNPEVWAKSEVVEGVPQHARAVFLRAAWNAIVPEGNDAWIDGGVGSFDRDPSGPCAVLVELFAGCFLWPRSTSPKPFPGLYFAL
jgi:hypothetical protein